MKKEYIVLVLMVLFIGVWFVYRPYAVRKKCLLEARKSIVMSTQSYEPLDTLKREAKQNELIEASYLSCVREKGLKQ